MIVRVIVVLKRTLVDNDCRFDNLCAAVIFRDVSRQLMVLNSGYRRTY